MVTTITEVLNIWNEIGVFSYMIPFLLIFAVVYAILDKTRVLSNEKTENRGIISIIAISVSLLSLQFDFVSEFFAIIFPRFGVGLSLFLVILIFLGFFYPEDEHGAWSSKVAWVGWAVGIGVFIWALDSWDEWGSYSAFGMWFSEMFWAIIVIVVIVLVVILMTPSSSTTSKRK